MGIYCETAISLGRFFGIIVLAADKTNSAIEDLASPAYHSEAELRETIRRLVSSSTFSSAPRLRSVLSYLLQSLEDGTVDQVSEQSIGQAVFGKPEGYNASEDNIVRVTVRHLRTRLEDFYRTEGSSDPFLLEIPKGRYIPVLAVRSRTAGPAWDSAQALSTAGATPEGSQEEMPPASHPAAAADLPSSEVALEVEPVSGVFRISGFQLGLPIVVCVWLCALALGYLWRAETRPLKPASAVGGLLRILGDHGSPVVVVVTDSDLQAYREIFGKQMLLGAYIDRAYPPELPQLDPRLARAMRFATRSNETNVSSAIVAAGVKSVFLSRSVVIKHPHDVSMREFQDQEDMILLGGPWINPWGQLFENRLNFRLIPNVSDPWQSRIHDFAARPGEATDYVAHDEGNLSVNYVRIAILPNFTKNGHVVLVGAASPEALEAGGTFLSSNDPLPKLLKDFGVNSVTDLPAVELVLEVKGLNSVPGAWRIVAERAVP